MIIPEAVDRQVARILLNPYIMTVTKVLFILYASQIAPPLPPYITRFFRNTIFQIVALAVILYISNKDIQLAIIMAVVFVFGTQFISPTTTEHFAPFDKNYTVDFDAKIIEPNDTEVYPGCTDVKMDQILRAFSGDCIKVQTALSDALKTILESTIDQPVKDRLQKIAHVLGAPYNIDWSKGDEIAPHIATLLMFNGFNISESCMVP